MRRMARIHFFLLSVLLPLITSGQEKEQMDETEQIILERIRADPQQLNDQSFLEQVEELFLQPRDINAISDQEVLQIEFLNREQANNLIEYRRSQGSLYHINELQAIAGFEKETIKKMMSRFYVAEKITPRRVKKSLKAPDRSFFISRIMSQLQEKKGYRIPFSEGGFRGSNYGTRFRFLHRKYGSYSFGFLLDKDPGEGNLNTIFQQSLPTDFISAHAYFEGKKTVRKFSIGDFYLQMGEGLVFSSGFSMGKGAETIYSIKKPEPGIRPFTSAFENGGFRGLATTISVGKTEFTGFISRKSKNASYFTFGDSQIGIGALQTSGLHRTQLELSKKGFLQETTFGGAISKAFLKKSLKVNLEWKELLFSKPFEIRTKKPGFQFTGNHLGVYGSSFSLKRGSHLVFGEMALSSTGGIAILAGSILNLSRNWDIGILARSFSIRFYNPDSNPFSESSRTENENGVYLSAKWMPNHKWTIEGYSDLYSFPYLTTSTLAPSSGKENLIHFKYRPNKLLMIRMLVRNEIKSKGNESDKVRFLKVYLGIDRKIKEVLSSQTRVYYNHFDQGLTSKGLGLTQEVRVSLRKLMLTGMLGYFETEDFSTRVYFFEKNVFGEYQIPSFSGNGFRYLFLVKWNQTRRLSYWVRIAQTNYFDRNIMGSGKDEIRGNKLTEVKFQLRYKLF
jgi:Helix-hairpin-helix motif